MSDKKSEGMELIRDKSTLRALCGDASDTVRCKIHRRLTPQAQQFIRRSPLLMLATASAAGVPTVSPKGDYPGFAHAPDARTIYIPERSGNNLLFTLQNLLENPQVGVLFLVPHTTETLRVSGTAQLTTDAGLCAQLSAHGQPARLVVAVQVTESYFHCGKALIRSSLWQPERWGEAMRISLATEIAANKAMQNEDVTAFDQYVANEYESTLPSER